VRPTRPRRPPVGRRLGCSRQFRLRRLGISPPPVRGRFGAGATLSSYNPTGNVWGRFWGLPPPCASAHSGARWVQK